MVHLIIPLSSIALFAFFALDFLCILPAYARLNSKGYRSPLVMIYIASPPFALFFLSIAFMTAHKNALPFGEVLTVGAVFAVLPLVACGVVLAVAILIPERRVKVVGKRQIRFPYGFLGVVMMFGTVACSLLGWIFGWPSYGFRAIQFLVPIGLYCFYLEERRSAPTLEDVAEEDPRAPVLYLRAFNEEQTHFVEMSWAEMKSFTHYVHDKLGPTLEQYFSRAIADRIGPLVALGSPEDYLPPEGAARLYAHDADWMDRFQGLANAAAGIIIQRGNTKNLRWELEQLRRQDLQSKIFIVTPPQEPRRSIAHRIRWHLGRQAYELLRRLEGKTSVGWPVFAKELRSLGYDLDPEEPAKGTVLTFDEQGDAITLTFDARTPSEYAEAMQSWIRRRG